MPARAARDSTEDRDGEVRRLTAAIAAGDEEAFGTFYETWFDRFFSLATRLTRRDESFCLDVVQEAMLRVIRALRPMESHAALSGWLVRVVHSTAIDQLRREGRRRRRERRAFEQRRRGARETSEAPPARLEIDEEIAWLRERLRELDSRDRHLLDQRFARGKTLKDVGRALGVSGNVAHGRLRRLLRRLRASAKEMFDE